MESKNTVESKENGNWDSRFVWPRLRKHSGIKEEGIEEPKPSLHLFESKKISTKAMCLYLLLYTEPGEMIFQCVDGTECLFMVCGPYPIDWVRLSETLSLTILELMDLVDTLHEHKLMATKTYKGVDTYILFTQY